MAPESGIRLDEARLAGMDPGRKQAIRAEIAEGVGAISIGGDASEATINTDVTIEGNRYALSLTPEIIDALRPVLAAPLSNLPPAPAHFVDRAEDVTALLRALASGAESQAITALRGIGGIGKTTLAVLVARKLALHYPSAQILIKLRGTDPEPVSARAAMEDVIRRFAPTADLPDDEEDIAEIYRDLLGKNKSLLILDNARDAGQVAPLLPPAPSAAIVTTRRAVDLPGLEVRRLDQSAARGSRGIAARAARRRRDTGAGFGGSGRRLRRSSAGAHRRRRLSAQPAGPVDLRRLRRADQCQP